jgi:hypothetical protein
VTHRPTGEVAEHAPSSLVGSLASGGFSHSRAVIAFTPVARPA